VALRAYGILTAKIAKTI